MGGGRSQGANSDIDERAIDPQRSRLQYRIRSKYSGMPRRINSEDSESGPRAPPPHSMASAASSAAVDTRSSFLGVGQEFVGIYYDGIPADEWSVKVYIRGSDVERGSLCGELHEAVVDGAPGVVRIWEGEIIDNQNYTFFQSKWDVNWNLHKVQWNHLPEFQALEEEVESSGGLLPDTASGEYTYMRWRDYFDSVLIPPTGESRLHFVCFRRCDGKMHSRYQERFPSAIVHNLVLRPTIHGHSGYSFPTYQLQ